MSVLDFIFPKRCVNCKKQGSYLCENCFIFLSFDVKSLCLICNKASYNGLTHPVCKSRYVIDGCFSALSYTKTTQKLIYNFKYKPYLSDLKNLLAEIFYESIIQNENFIHELEMDLPAGRQVFIPIPLYPLKLKKRGYNQAEILAKTLAKKFNLPVQDILERTKETKTQVGLSNIDRKLNIKDAFSIKPELNIKGKSIFLIDDVVTTGSTLKGAAKILKKNGVKRVIGLTLARD